MKNILTLALLLTAPSLFAQGAFYNLSLYAEREYPANAGAGIWGYSDTMMVNGKPKIRELALMCTFRGLSIVDITSPELRELAFIPSSANNPNDFNNNWREVRTSGRYAYITTEASGAGVQIVHLRPDENNPDSIRYVGKFNTGGNNNQHNIGTDGMGYSWQVSPYIYVCGGTVTQGLSNSGGVAIYNVSNPESPVLVGRYGARYVHDVYVRNDTMYCSNINNNQGVDIVSVANKSAPVRLKAFTYPNAGTHNIWLSDDSKFIFTTDEISPPGQNIFRAHDARDFNTIIINAGTYKSPTGGNDPVVHNAYIKSHWAILAHYTEGVKIVDVTEPYDLVEVGAFDTFTGSGGSAPSYNGCWGVYPYYPSGKIVASNIPIVFDNSPTNNGKLMVFTFNNARAGTVYGTIRDAQTNAPIANAEVKALDYYNKSRRSNANGFYRIRTVQGTAKRFVFSATGYRADTLTLSVPENGDSIQVDVALLNATSGTTSSNAPTDFQLHQNYPNPFNPTTTITYQLPKASDVRLEVFDMMGRKIATLVSARQSEGMHSVSFVASEFSLTSGVYFYRLSAGGRTETKRMTLLK
ncbi:MAG: choice-of-anchor B family protein [Chloroherpetonaceae bacterium]